MNNLFAIICILILNHTTENKTDYFYSFLYKTNLLGLYEKLILDQSCRIYSMNDD
jgi:hypothetical protein